MLFSIIIPVYNVEKYIADCLNSVLKQSFQDWEAICVDDGSTDNSPAILSEYASKDSRIKVITQNNAGTAAARNSGLEEASGDYVFFLDSDDWIEEEALQILANRLSDEDILCFSGKRYFEAAGHFNQADFLPEKEYSNGMDYYNENALLPRDFAFVCVVLRIYNRLFLLNNGLLFDEDITYEDNLWVPITIYHARSIKVIHDSLYIYRIREGSKMQDVSLSRKIDLLNVANRLATFFVPLDGFKKTTVYQSLTHHYQSVFATKSPRKEEKHLLSMVDWKMYKAVSRTKARHRVQYLALRINPGLFRFIANR